MPMSEEQYKLAESQQTEQARQQLRDVSTISQALTILSSLSNGQLRLIESDYTSHPGPTLTLRERVAQLAYVACRDRFTQTHDTKLVTPAVVREWALSAVAEWLPGYTDFDERVGGQFQIRPIAVEGDPKAPKALIFRVKTFNDEDPKDFRVAVTVDAC